MQNHFSSKRSVAFFPSVKTMSGNSYWPLLASNLEKSGIKFIYDTPNIFNWSWLLRNRKRVRLLHIHYCQGFFSHTKEKTRLKNVLRFAIYLLLARVLGFLTVFTLHNLRPTYPLKPAWLDYLGHWVAVNLSAKVIVHCQEAHRLLTKRYKRSRGIFVVDHPNFIDVYPNTISKETARKRLNLSSNSFVFAFVGGIRPNKGIEVLIRVFRILKDRNFRLVVAGKIFPPESYTQSLQTLAAGDERISFYLQHIPDDEIQVFMNAADIVVLPFSRILTSSSVILAMSFGRPVIVPRMGCLPELIKPDAGWLFEPNDPVSLAEIMQSALTRDICQAGLQAFNKVSSCSPGRFAEQTIHAYWG